MSFRDRMRVGVSNGEVMVFEELQRRRLNRGMTTQVGFEFGEGGVRGTWADFYWEHARYAVFIDGPHHLKGRQGEKDELIDRALGAMGIKVDRFPYRAPLTKRRLKEICDRIEERLTGAGKPGGGGREPPKGGFYSFPPVSLAPAPNPRVAPVETKGGK